MYQVCLLVIVFRKLSVVSGSVLTSNLFLSAFDGATQQNGTLNNGCALDSGLLGCDTASLG
jgi:hypothetical protein